MRLRRPTEEALRYKEIWVHTENKGENMKHMGLLGLKVRDAVTGSEGVVTSLSFDLYGCIQAVVTPSADKEGAIKDGHWLDVTRLVVLDHKPVMDLPNFESGYVAEGKKWCAEKPKF